MASRAKTRTAFFCTDCGNETPRWQGQCPACDAWNTLVEEPRAASSGRRRAGPVVAASDRRPPRRLGEVEADAETGRWLTTIGDFDHVLGGGIVPGSLVLIGGEPGIGKSTLLLQVAAHLSAAGRPVLYVSGEESALQVRLRADRLSEPTDEVTILETTALEAVLEEAAALQPDILFVDSVQTVHVAELESAAGSVGQVRECAARLQRFAKETGTAVFLVGHVTKGGGIAGPKTLEHIVDTVLYFEGAPAQDHRILRTTKNRFGGSDELGVFRMSDSGLHVVENPSALFLSARGRPVPGSAVTAGIEGTRPLLVEVQALVARASYGAPQRVAAGLDPKRLALLLAVLEKRAGRSFSQLDVFLNVVGGLRLRETGADLAVCAALLSSAADRPLPSDAVFLGEVGLGGEIRRVSQTDRRLAEAARMGFRTAFLAPEGKAPEGGVTRHEVEDLHALAGRLFS